MVEESHVKRLFNYIKSREDFELIEPPDVPHYHMGATITDAVLQAGVRYETVVKPRVNNLKQNYPEAKTTTGFLNLIRKIDLSELLDWNGIEKPKRILGVIQFLAVYVNY